LKSEDYALKARAEGNLKNAIKEAPGFDKYAYTK
jgi:hypothetical protein